MGRSYVAIYQNKEVNHFIYFDFNKNEFFKIAERKNQSLILLASFVSIIFYALMKNVLFGININPFMIIFISSMIGIVLGYISIKLTNRAIEKGLPDRKKVIHPTDQDIRMYVIEGRKQLRIQICAILFLLFMLLITSLFLYFVPQSVLMFLANTILWIIIILITWAIRPIKGAQVRRWLEKELEKGSS